MTREIIIALSIALWPLVAIQAQAPEASLSDQERIAITPIVPAELTDIPASAKPILENQLQYMANSHGFGGTALQTQFFLVARPVVTEKFLSATAPPLIKMRLETTLYIADYISKTVFATTSITTNGVGYSDNEAYTSAVRSIKKNAPELADFMKSGREGIVSYYNSRCDFILGRAEMLDSMGQSDAALSLLLGVPEVCHDCFQKAIRKSNQIYQSALERQCHALILHARSRWSARPDKAGADEASAILAMIPANTKCAEEARVISDEIYKKMMELEKWDRKVYEDNRKMQTYYLETVRKIGVAQAENQPDVIYHLNFRGWLW